MGRARRLHVPGGTYYLHLRANSGQNIFEDDEDVEAFNQLAAAALMRCDAELYAFCWTRADARLAMRIGEVPLGRVVHLITAPYSRHVHKRYDRKGNLFTRYHAVLIASESYVLRLVRYIHLAPDENGFVSDPARHRWSSHQAYLGDAGPPWVTTAPVLRILSRLRGRGRDVYQKYMQEGNPQSDEQRFESNVPYVPKTAGGEDWLQPQPIDRNGAQGSASLDALVDAVAKKLGVSREDVLSPSRGRRVSLARALVASHATRGGIATLSSVARYFGRHPSSLSEGLHRYTKAHRTLFSQSLADLIATANKKS
jgi:putative transposase